MLRGERPEFIAMVLDSGDAVPEPQLPDGYAWMLWRPRGFRIVPPGMPWLLGIMYWVASCWLALGSGGYAVLLVMHRGAVVHHSIALPRFFRHRFLGDRDLMVGGTWTDPVHRCRGLARFALGAMVSELSAPGRRFWYVAHERNTASLRVAERCGFRPAGRCARTRRLGLRLLGEFVRENREAS